jgi:glycosyltransferase involved in cell wall biosynthesis
MNQTPSVSGILIFLNAEAFLEEAIESVLVQTWHDWELLLVDDGSTDRSTVIARRYAELHPARIFYLQHAGHMNRGKSTSRNLGIQRARGEYVAFLDADDVWLPSKLARQFATLSRYPEAVMLYGPTRYWHSWESGARRRDYLGVLGVRPDVLFRPPYLLTCYLARTGIVPGICSILARRKAVVEVGGFEESIQQMFEDQTLIAKLCLYGPVFVDSGCYDLYRQHPGSSSSQAVKAGTDHPWRPSLSHLPYLEWLADYVETHPGSDDNLHWKLKRELWIQRHRFAGNMIGLARLVIEIVRRKLSSISDAHSGKAIMR